MCFVCGLFQTEARPPRQRSVRALAGAERFLKHARRARRNPSAPSAYSEGNGHFGAFLEAALIVIPARVAAAREESRSFLP